jgi:hypothetical protein
MDVAAIRRTGELATEVSRGRFADFSPDENGSGPSRKLSIASPAPHDLRCTRALRKERAIL